MCCSRWRFVKNLNQSIKLPDLRALLYELFARYGDIHEIVCSGAVPAAEHFLGRALSLCKGPRAVAAGQLRCACP